YESPRRWSEACPARLLQDFAGQRRPAELRGRCRNYLQSADNNVRIRTVAFLLRSRSNDDLWIYSEARVAMRRNFGAQPSARPSQHRQQTGLYRRAWKSASLAGSA